MNAPIPLEEAWTRLLARIEPLPAETIDVELAAGRFLNEDVAACRSQPDADLSAMDGFALAGDAPWTLVGESRAGSPFCGALGSSQAVRISTGAAMPAGAESVLIVENALLDGEAITATEPPVPGRHIRRKGFDFAEGDPLLHKGSVIGPAQIALLRAAGWAKIAAARAPTIVILECGDELVHDPENCPPGKLPASNGAMLAAMARRAGAEARIVGPVADTLDAHIEALRASADADLIVTSGGASVGEHDLVRPALDALGAKLSFWRVAIRPGKPLLVAGLDQTLVLGLPGNPVSSFVTGFVFMLPAIRAMLGAANPLPRSIPVALGRDLPEGGERREFVRAQLVDGKAIPIAERDSSALRALASADLLIDRPIDAPAQREGAAVPCYWLANSGIA